MDSGQTASLRKQTVQLTKITQSENVHSLNHLYQSAAFLTLQSVANGKSADEAIVKSLQLQSLTRKATLRIDPDLKRALCKGCSVPLFSGITRSTRICTFPPSSRIVLTRCLICSYTARQIAPPKSSENSNKASRRCRKIQQRKEMRHLAEKIAGISKRQKSLNSTSKAAMIKSTEKRVKEAPKRRWSQRERRRAGKAKAELYRKSLSTELKGSESIKNPGRSEMLGISSLPLYRDRLLGNTSAWDNCWPEGTTSLEKEAIRVLRGNHVITSGVGRGGSAGKEVSLL